MRRQELIYAQNDGFTRNKDIVNISTSSDICIFESPIFIMTGATKMISGMTSGDTGIHIIEIDGDPIDFIFKFSGSAMALDTIFNYEIYKFDNRINMFKEPYILRSNGEMYNSFNITNQINQTIESFNMSDGEYIIKPSYNHKICTDVLNKLGVRANTNTFTTDGEFNLYNAKYDYYFAAIYAARQPLFEISPIDDRLLGSLNVLSIIPEGSGQTTFTMEISFNGSPIITLNGLVLAVDEDYVLSGSTFTLVEPTFIEDIITVIFVGVGSQNGLIAKSHIITSAILHGPENKQGNETVYYNTTSGKFEFYLDVNPINGNDIMVSVNGAVLANNIDYYQSISNKRRLIFEGNILFNDVITVVYNSNATYVGAINQSPIQVYWTIDISPEKVNGKFILQLSDNKDFTNIISSGETPYIVGNKVYNSVLPVIGSVGDKRYYRVINEKNFVTILGDLITTIKYSEIIPIIVQTNSANNY